QTRNDRKIKSYYEHIAKGKKTSLQQEIIVQVGSGFRGKDYEFGDGDWDEANEILEEYFSDFEKRNPNLKVYNAVIHNDETSPHLHINFVPVAGGYKRGLEKQVAFDRAVKQQSVELDVSHPFEAWKNSEIAVLERLMNERGIEREEVGTNEYEDTNELKEKTEELRKLEIKVENELKKLDALADEPTSAISSEVKPIIALGEGNKPIPKVELKKTMFGGYSVEPEQIESLKDYTNRLKHENSDLRDELEECNQIITLVEGNKTIPKVELKKTMFGGYSVEPEQIESLKDYTNRLKHENSDLRDELEESKENYKRLRKSYLNDRKMLDKLVED